MADPPGSKKPQLSWLPTYDPMSVGIGYMPEEDIQAAHELRPYITEIGKQGTISSMPFGISTAYNWNDMGKWGRAASLGFDIVDFVTMPGTMSPLRAGFNQFARNWSPTFSNMFRQLPDNTDYVRFGKLPGDEIQQAFGPTPWSGRTHGYTNPYKPKPTIGQAYPPVGQELPLPKKVGYSYNWGQSQDADLPKYMYEKGVSSYQMIPYKDKSNPATKWLVRNPQTLDSADPRALDPRYTGAEEFQDQFSQMGKIEDLSHLGIEAGSPMGQMANRGTYAITGKPVSSLGADFEQLIDPTHISSYQRIPHESLQFSSQELSSQMFKGFDMYGNPIGNRPLASLADINIPWVTPGGMPIRSAANVGNLEEYVGNLEESFQQRPDLVEQLRRGATARGPVDTRGRRTGDTGG